MKGSEDAVFGMGLCALDLAHQIFWNIVAIRDSHALLHTENNALALFKQTRDYRSVVFRTLRPRDDVGIASRIAGIRVRSRREKFYERSPKLFHCDSYGKKSIIPCR